MSYAELHCLTNFSFLEAASHPEELVARAAELGYSALAVTDINTLAGIVRANTATKDHAPLKLIVGSEIRPLDAPPVVVWVRNRRGYANLCRLITAGRRQGPKGECHLTLDDIAQHAEGLIAGIVPPAFNEEFSIDDAHHYRDIFEDCYLLAELHRGPHDQHRRQWLQAISRQTSLPLVAAGSVLFHVPERKPLHDVLTAIRLRTTVAQVGEILQPNAQRHLRPLDSLKAIYTGLPHALERTLEIANQCTFSLDELRYEYPEELAPPGFTPIQYLRHLTWEGAKQRYPHGLPEKIRLLLEHELNLIEELRYEPYFLTVWDIVRFARSRDILCQGRGSAANSAVCYCLEITAVDPQRIDVLFERFISRERDEAPDICGGDLDKKKKAIQMLRFGKC